MADHAIVLYGWSPSFDPKAGPATAIVATAGGERSCLVDRERGRCRIGAIPGPVPDQWTSPRGLLMAARSGRWGLSVVEDRLPDPARSADSPSRSEDAPGPATWRRHHLPRDACSCPRCGRIVAVRRRRASDAIEVVTPSRWLFSRIAAILGRPAPPIGPARAGVAHACSVLPFGPAAPPGLATVGPGRRGRERSPRVRAP